MKRSRGRRPARGNAGREGTHYQPFLSGLEDPLGETMQDLGESDQASWYRPGSLALELGLPS